MRIGRKTEDKGISMVELIIVITVMGILISGTIGMMQYISYGNTKKCASAINMALNQVQLENMGKKDTTYLYLYTEGNNHYMKIWNKEVNSKSELLNGKKIANDTLSIYYKANSSATKTSLADTPFLKLAYNKATGAFKDNAYCSEIILEGKGVYNIHLVKQTGKTYIE